MEQEIDDTKRVDWLLDLLSLGDDNKTDAKSIALAGAILLKKTGRDAIDTAMQSCP